MNSDIKLAINYRARSSMGVYPQSYISDGVTIPRNEWQNGWNAYGQELLKREIEITKWYDDLNSVSRQKIDEMIVGDAVSISFEDNKLLLTFNTSDLFAWGYANWDEITPEMLGPLYAAWKEDGESGMCVWWCKRENMKPQWPVEENWRKRGLWDDELEALPANKYDEAIGRWKNKSRLEAIEALIPDLL